MKTETATDIKRHLEHARAKYNWQSGMESVVKFGLIEKELNELGVAMLKRDLRGTRREALDCIAVLIRIVEGE